MDVDGDKENIALKETITTHQTIRNTIARWQETGSVKDRTRIDKLKLFP